MPVVRERAEGATLSLRRFGLGLARRLGRGRPTDPDAGTAPGLGSGRRWGRRR